MNKVMRTVLLCTVIFCIAYQLQAQKKSKGKYPKVVVSVDVQSTLPLKETFEYVVPIDLEHIFNQAYKRIPSIDSTSNTTAWFVPGQERVVYFNDGSTAQEKLLSVIPSSGFTYRVNGFTSSLRHLIKQINGSWTFIETASGDIQIEWTYEFVPKHFLARFLVKNIVAKQIEAPMTNALDIIKQELGSGQLYPYTRRVGNW